MVIVGDVEPQQDARAKCKQLFGDIPAKKIPARPPVQLASVSTQTLDMQTDLPYGLAVVSFRMPGSDSPDFAAANVLADVLSSQRGTLVCAGSGRQGARCGILAERDCRKRAWLMPWLRIRRAETGRR